MSTMQGCRRCLLPAVVVLASVSLPGRPAHAAQLHVAVFNFQMKSKTSDWVWLEKCLADQITTDLSRAAGLSVIARDSMQAVAQEIEWAPEMATRDAERMGLIRKRLRIEYLVSGVYSVEGDRLELTGQIVSSGERKVLFRKALSGKTDDVILLQKKLSAELAAWFTKKPPDQILPNLPIWTRSIPALRALYQGMDLYDQGRYPEAWHKFRLASREDRAYVEALYWVGKMYYFMARYEHARRALERFVYMDESHPRITDCIMEYLHTYEAAGASPGELFKVYANFCRRFGDERISTDAWKDCNVYLRPKMGRLLLQMDRPREAMPYFDMKGYKWTGTLGHYDCYRRIKALSGGWPGPEKMRHFIEYSIDEVVCHTEKDGAFHPTSETSDQSGTVFISSGRNRRARRGLILIPPNGHVMESVRLFPISKARKGKARIMVSKNAYGDVAVVEVELDKMLKDGVLFDNLPRAAFLAFNCEVDTERDFELTRDIISGFKRDVKFGKLGPTGIIDVRCLNTGRFKVDLDGHFARTYPGTIAMVDPGQHVLRFTPLTPGGAHGQRTMKVVVKAGETVRVEAVLPWKEDSSWNAWTNGTMVGTHTPGKMRSERTNISILPDEDAIRIVWAFNGDIWWAESTDGQRYTKARKMELPISSGWQEWDVHVTRDESGRYVMAFLSDRNARHEAKVYVCWSRDFINWSAPAVVDIPDALSQYGQCGICTDDRGRLVLSVTGGTYDKKVITFLTSTRAHSWKTVGRFQIGRAFAPRLVHREDGEYELFFCYRRNTKNTTMPPGVKELWRLARYSSSDLKKWSRRRNFSTFASRYGSQQPYLAATRHGKRSFVAISITGGKAFIARESDAGEWKVLDVDTAPDDARLAMAHHPRWGSIVSWLNGQYLPARQFLNRPFSGPYVIRGPDLNGLAYTKIAPYVPKSIDPPKPKPKPKPEKQVPPGQLVRHAEAPDHMYHYFPLEATAKEHFTSPGKPVGDLTARARVVTLKSAAFTVHVALDFTYPDSKYPDIARVDFSGRGDFKTCANVKRARMSTTRDKRHFTIKFIADDVPVTYGGQTHPARLDCFYSNSPQGERLAMRIGSWVSGSCYFGKALYKVTVVDNDCNFEFNNPGQLNSRRDILEIYKKDRKDMLSLFYGQLAMVDGVLYRVTVSRDGTTVRANPYSGKTGTVRINHAKWEAIFWNEDHLLLLKGGIRPVPIPVGKFKVINYTDWERSSKGKLTVTTVGEKDHNGNSMPPITIEEGKETAIVIGSPRGTRLGARRQGNRVAFLVYIAGTGGRLVHYVHPIYLFKSTVTIVDAQGKQVAKIRGTERGELPVWQIPHGLKGRLSAEIILQPDKRVDKVEGTTFTIE